MKQEIRVLGIDDAPFDKFKHKTVLVIGAFFRGGRTLEGVLSTRCRVDGVDATEKLIQMVKKSKFFPQIQAIFTGGLNIAGFNMIDIHGLSQETGKPVIAIVRRKPNLELIKKTLLKLGMSDRVRFIEKAGKPVSYRHLYFQAAGVSVQDAKQFIDVSVANSHIPEALRIAHIIGAGVVKGESRGKA